MGASWLSRLRARCWTTRMGTGKSAGSAPRTSLSASIPPADAAIATTSKGGADLSTTGGTSRRTAKLWPVWRPTSRYVERDLEHPAAGDTENLAGQEVRGRRRKEEDGAQH